MSTNLRLDDEAVAALRAAAQRSGRSQQDLLREAVDQYLGLHQETGARKHAIESGLVRVPAPFQDTKPGITLPKGVSSVELLDRENDR